MKRIIIPLLFFFISQSFIAAHPHMFIDTKLRFEFNDSGLIGYRVTWWFDGGFTAMILTDYDLDKNYTFSPAEVRDIENNAFSNLENYGYFMHLYLDGVRKEVTAITEFDAYLDGKRLVYEFFIPVEVPGRYDWRTLELAIYDETFFCDIGYIEKNPLSSKGYYSFEIASGLGRDSDTTITYDNTNTAGGRSDKQYTGFANPIVATIQFRKK